MAVGGVKGVRLWLGGGVEGVRAAVDAGVLLEVDCWLRMVKMLT